MTTLTTLKHLCLFSPLLAMACATRGLDLGGPDEITASSDPTVLGIIQEQVAQLRVDGERLYWLGSGTTRTAYANGGGHEGKAGFPSHPWALRSCKKNDCAATRVTYAPDSVDSAAGFGIADGFISWFQFVELPADYPAYEHLVTCYIGSLGEAPALKGAELCPPQSIGQATPLLPPPPHGRPVAAFDGDYTYFIRNGGTGEDIVSAGFGVDGPTFSPQLVASTSARVITLAVQEDYIYWISAPDTVKPSTDGSIQRTLKDGSGHIEPLMQNIPMAKPHFGEEGYPAGGLALDATYFYWADTAQGGVIQRCPLAGCEGEPEVVVSQVGTTMALQVDGDKLFWSSRKGDDTSYSLSSCTLGDCSVVDTIVAALETPAAVATDNQYLYAASSDDDTPFFFENGFGFVNSLRRFPK